MKTLQILGICGSLRKQSRNMAMLRYAQANAPTDMAVTIADLSVLPFYNEDIKDKPAAVQTLFAQMQNADALLFACPEYNYSLAPALKNALDWASREKDNYLLADKPAAIMGAGGGMGTSRSQYHLRQVAVALNLHILNKPEVFCNGFAEAVFDANGNLVDTRTQGLITQQLSALQQWTLRLR